LTLIITNSSTSTATVVINMVSMVFLSAFAHDATSLGYAEAKSAK
jgi:hypothetical protein